MFLPFQTVLSLLVVLTSFVVRPIAAIPLDLDDPESVKNAAATVAAGLVALYNGDEPGGVLGKWPYPPYYWWESGAAWGALVNYWHYTGDDTYNSLIMEALTSQLSETYDFMPPAERFNLGNDDQAFWSFGAMSAAEYGFPDPPAPAPSWLTVCENVFNDFISRWADETCGGGLKWQIFPENNGYTYKNAISNGGAFALGARLARMTGNQTYVEWATKFWDWTEAIGLIDDSYSVFDGTDETINCTEVNHDRYSYNVAIFLHGAAVLQNYTDEDIWIERTKGMLDAATAFVGPTPETPDVLYEAICEKDVKCNIDQLSMKGYLARWLAATAVMAPWSADSILPILRASAAGAASACSGGDDNSTCGFKWYTGEYDGTTGMGQQLVALEAMYSTLFKDTVPPKSHNEERSNE